MYYEKKRIDKVKTGKLIMNAIADSIYSYEEVSIYLELNSSRVIYDWIKGIKLPSLENLLNLSIILEKEVEELIAMR